MVARSFVTLDRRFRTARIVAVLAMLLVLLPSAPPVEAAPPTVTCNSDGNIFNTGYNAATGGYLANGKPDANWEASGRYSPTSPPTKTSLPPSNATWTIPTAGNRAPSNWYASPYLNAQWIAAEPGTSADGDWYYRYRFTLDPSVDPSTFALRVDFLADNDVAEVFVNNVAQSPLTSGLPQTTSSPYSYRGYAKESRSQTFLNHSWRTGANEIIVQIKSGASYEGFVAMVQPSQLCPRPSLSLSKTASPDTVTFAGQRITYSFVVKNTGNVALSNVGVQETAFSGRGTVPAVSCPSPTLDIGQVETCSATYTATQADLDAGTITNIATASGAPPYGPAVSSAPSQAAVSATKSAALSIVKATTKASVTDLNEQIPYTFTVTNLGNVTLHGIAVADPKIGAPTCPTTQLGPGQQTVCTAGYGVTQADLDAGRVANVATASGLDPTGGQATAGSSEVVVPALYQPGLNIVKATTSTTFNSVGQQIPYTFTVVNLGNVTLHGIAVTDPKISNVSCPLSELGPGEGTVCTGSYTTTQDDLDTGQVINQATVAGKTPINEDVTATSNRQFVGATVRPELAVVKSTTTTHYDKVGQQISYTIAVTNTGNQNVRDIKVTDPLLGGTVCTFSLLAPGVQNPCTVTYSTTTADLDAGRIANQATAAGTDPSNSPVTATSNQVVVPAIYRPGLTMVKSTTTTALGSVGAQIPYRFGVINTGNVTIDNVKISDPKIAGVTCAATKLAIGEQTACDGTYSLTQADLDAGQVINQASVVGDVPPGGPKLDPTLSNDVTIRAASSVTPLPVMPQPVMPQPVMPQPVMPQPATPRPQSQLPQSQLPRTGRNIMTELRAAIGLCILGGVLRIGSRSRPTGGGLAEAVAG